MQCMLHSETNCNCMRDLVLVFTTTGKIAHQGTGHYRTGTATYKSQTTPLPSTQRERRHVHQPSKQAHGCSADNIPPAHAGTGCSLSWGSLSGPGGSPGWHPQGRQTRGGNPPSPKPAPGCPTPGEPRCHSGPPTLPVSPAGSRRLPVSSIFRQCSWYWRQWAGSSISSRSWPG